MLAEDCGKFGLQAAFRPAIAADPLALQRFAEPSRCLCSCLFEHAALLESRYTREILEELVATGGQAPGDPAEETP